MLEVTTRRGLLSILGGMFSGQPWWGCVLESARRPHISLDMIKDPRCLRVLLLTMVLHMAGNASVDLPFYLKYIALASSHGW